MVAASSFRGSAVNLATLRKLGIVVNAGLLFATPHAASAQSSADFTVGEVRSEYVHAGYQVSQPTTWWTADQVTTFQVTDANIDRVLMVLVYPDSSIANS